MSAHYRLVQNPDREKSGEKQPLHARFVPMGVKRLDDLVRDARGRSTFSSADIKGALQLFQDLISDALVFGYEIELDGIGTFGLSLKCRPVMNKKEIRAESIHFKDVTFRSSRKLRDRLNGIPLVRFEEKEVEGFTPEECEQRVLGYLSEHTYISGKVYRALCRCGKTKASTDLKRMLQEGKLERRRVGTSLLYKLVQTNKEA